MNRVLRPTLLQGIIIWTLTACFFLYEFFVRASFSPMALLLEDAFHSSHSELGFISSAYYFAYAAMQIPIGIMVDRYGVRWLLTAGAFFCALGCLLFSQADTIKAAALGRFLMGLGSSVAFVSLLTIALHWFSRKIYGLMAGMTQILGMIGPMIAGAPLAWILTNTHNDWRLIMMNTALLGFSLTTIIVIFVRNHPQQDALFKQRHPLTLKKQLLSLLKNSQIRWIGLYAFFIYGAIPLVGELWGAAFLQQHGFSLSEAASINSFLFLGLGLGSPLVGALSDAIGNRKSVLTTCAFFGIIFSTLLVWVPLNSVGYIFTFFAVGFAVGGQTLSFAALTPHTEPHTESTAIGLNNTMVMLGGGVIQFIAGSLLSHAENSFWSMPYSIAMSLMIVFFIIAWIISVTRLKSN